MKLVKISVVWMILLALSGHAWAQGFGKPVDDGAGEYARKLIEFHRASVANLLKKVDIEPFAVSFYGWRALTIVRLPFNKYEGTHLTICRLALSVYDKELDEVLQTLATRPTSMTDFVEATPAEKSAVQKFVVQKYGGKYLTGLSAITAGDSQAAPEKKDEGAAWKYRLGAVLGELAGSVTKWFVFPNNAKYDEAISGYFASLDKLIREAPKDAPPELLTNLKQLAAFGSKKFFAPDERQQIGAALKQTLPTTIGFAKPLPKALEDFANAVEKANPAPAATKPAPPALTDTAKAKEVAAQYRQEGLAKYNSKMYDPAIDDFNRALALDADNPQIYANRGQALLEKGEVEKAIFDFTKAINLGGVTAEDYYYLNERARAYYKKGEKELALADLNMAIALNAKNAYGYYMRGFIYKNQGNAAQARIDFQAAVNLNPNFQAAKDELIKLGK
ncbi:MAG: tetratricopeptide repeat protein [Acidobacteria bacterium]|nr:tetratricopeptide repeat protein [Acidobacteriota bacterium]